jgi:hypothetical protein
LTSVLGHLGEVEEARRVWAELIEINPNYSFTGHVGRQPFKSCVLVQVLGIERYVVDDPMYPNHFGCFRIRRVRIIDNQDETLNALGHTLPSKWWRDIFTLAGILRGNLTILLERW